MPETPDPHTVELEMRPASLGSRLAHGLAFGAIAPVSTGLAVLALRATVAADAELSARLATVASPLLVGSAGIGLAWALGHFAWTRGARRPRRVRAGPTGYEGPRNRRAPRGIQLGSARIRMLRRRGGRLAVVSPPGMPVQLAAADFEETGALDRIEAALRRGAPSTGEDGAWRRRERLLERGRIPWASASLALLLGVAYVRSLDGAATPEIEGLLARGAVLPGCLGDGAPWRLATGPLLHLHLPHLAANLGALLLLGWLAEGRLGTARTLAVTLGAALCGAFGSAVLGTLPSVGFSGGVLGLWAASAVTDLVHARDGLLPRGQAAVVALTVVAVQGASDRILPGIDAVAHTVGAFSGAAIGYLLVRRVDLLRGAPLRVRGLAALLGAGFLAAWTYLVLT